MYDQFAELVRSLHARTAAGDVNWQKSATGDGFDASFPDYSLSIWHDRRGDIRISIFNHEGDLLESFSNSDLHKHVSEQEPDGGYYSMMSEIYGNARRKALRVDEVVRGIIESLKARA